MIGINNNDNTSFQDESPSDKGLNKVIQTVREEGIHSKHLAKGINADEEYDTEGDEYSTNLMDDDLEDDEEE